MHHTQQNPSFLELYQEQRHNSAEIAVCIVILSSSLQSTSDEVASVIFSLNEK